MRDAACIRAVDTSFDQSVCGSRQCIARNMEDVCDRFAVTCEKFLKLLRIKRQRILRSHGSYPFAGSEESTEMIAARNASIMIGLDA